MNATRSPRPAPGSARRSSATRWSCSALRSIVWSIRIWLSVRSDEASSSSSMNPRMEVIGVRSSCDTVATTSSFIWVSSRSRLFCSISDCVTSFWMAKRRSRSAASSSRSVTSMATTT